MAVGNGKGGNKGKPITYSSKPAELGMVPFKHKRPQTPLIDPDGWILIPLREKYRR